MTITLFRRTEFPDATVRTDEATVANIDFPILDLDDLRDVTLGVTLCLSNALPVYPDSEPSPAIH